MQKLQDDKKPKTWDFQEHLVFKRFDSFVDRLNIIKVYYIITKEAHLTKLIISINFRSFSRLPSSF